MSSLSSLEVASGIWIIAVAAFLLVWPRTRGDSIELLTTALSPSLMVPVLLMGAYLWGAVLGLQTLGLWSRPRLADTFIWFFFSGVVLAFEIVGSSPAKPVLSTVLAKQVGVFVVVQFLLAAYTFGFLAWFLIIPLMVVVGLIEAVAEQNPVHRSVARAAEALQAILGIGIAAAMVVGVVQNWGEIWTALTLKRLLLGPILAILFLPLLYVLVLTSFYQQTFGLLNAGPPKDRGLKRYARWKIIRHFGLNVSKTRRMTGPQRFGLARARSMRDVDEALARASTLFSELC